MIRLSSRLLSTFPHNATIGLVGTGVVGTCVGLNLLRKGIKLVTHDKNEAATKKLRDNGAIWAPTPADCAEQSDVVVTALPAPPNWKNCLFESKSCLLDGLTNPNKIWIDHTTISPYLVETAVAQLKARNCTQRYLEAPVTGGISLLKEAKMTIFCGGDKELYEQMRPLLDMSASNTIYLGKHGGASIVKVISNMLAGAHLVVTGEAVMMAKLAGLPLPAVWDAIRMSAGNSFVWETEAPLIFNGTFDPEFTVELHCKDFDLGKEIALNLKAPTPVHDLSRAIYHHTMQTYGKNVGSSSPPRLLEDQTGVKMQVEGFDTWKYTCKLVENEESPGRLTMAVVHQTDGNKPKQE